MSSMRWILDVASRFDLIVSAGSRVDAFAPAARLMAAQAGIIHFEILPKNINKVVEAQIPVVGDVAANLAALVPAIKARMREGWFRNLKQWKEKYPFTFRKSEPGVAHEATGGHRSAGESDAGEEGRCHYRNGGRSAPDLHCATLQAGVFGGGNPHGARVTFLVPASKALHHHDLRESAKKLSN